MTIGAKITSNYSLKAARVTLYRPLLFASQPRVGRPNKKSLIINSMSCDLPPPGLFCVQCNPGQQCISPKWICCCTSCG
jgi:hypothetical protein